MALQEEAKSLVEQLALIKQSASPFPMYHNGNLKLVVSGVGIDAACTAVGYIASQHARSQTLFWLNIGTSGHKTFPIGKVVVASKISSNNDSKTFFPTPIFSDNFVLNDIVSHSKPVANYPDRACVDMEASGFCNAASRFSLSDYIQVVKVVSDNAEHPINKIGKNSLKLSMSLAARDICDLVRQFIRFAEREVRNELNFKLPKEFTEVHLTETQKVQIKKGLRKLSVLSNKDYTGDIILHKEDSASIILRRISSLCESYLPKTNND